MGSEKKDKSGIDRRALIKRAAAAGGAAWVAPVLVASLPAPAAAQSAAAGCYKYMFDWRWAPTVLTCPNGQLGSPQNDANPCAQNTGENHHNIGGVQQKFPNPNCCEDKAPIGAGGEGNVLQWNEFPDLPGGCIQMSSNQFCSTSENGVVVTFTMLCPGCYITDGMVRYDSSGELVADNPNYCAVASLSESTFASSKLISQSVTITFTGTKVPIWFKFYVGCGLTPGGDGYFPNTDCQFFATDTANI